MPRTHAPDLDEVYSLLASERRRNLCYHLLEANYGTVDRLARGIAALETDQAPREVSEEDERRVAVDLIHDHLPRLAEHDVLEFDARSGDVVAADGLEALRPFVKQAHEIEHETELPDPSRLSVLYSEPPEDAYLLEDD